MLRFESSRGVRERRRGRRVEPLHVVDGDEDRHGRQLAPATH